MNKEEYYKRIEKINNRFKTDRVSADEEYQLVCQRNYLSTKYIEHLEQQCKKQKEANSEWERKCSKYKNIINKIKEYAQDLRLYDNESLEFKISEDLLSILDLENLGDVQ